MKAIKPSELYNLINDKKTVIIDIREPDEYLKGHIPKSKNIPYDVLKNNIKSYLNSNLNYYIICQAGITSKEIAGILYTLGYKAKSISGGIEKWNYDLI